MIQRYCCVIPSGVVKRKFVKDVAPPGVFLQFPDFARSKSQSLHNAILVDLVCGFAIGDNCHSKKGGIRYQLVVAIILGQTELA